MAITTINIDDKTQMACTFNADGRHCDLIPSSPSSLKQTDSGQDALNELWQWAQNTWTNFYSTPDQKKFQPFDVYQRLSQSGLYDCQKQNLRMTHASDRNRQETVDQYSCKVRDSHATLDDITSFSINASERFHYMHLNGFKGETSATYVFVSVLTYANENKTEYFGSKKITAGTGNLGAGFPNVAKHIEHTQAKK